MLSTNVLVLESEQSEKEITKSFIYNSIKMDKIFRWKTYNESYKTLLKEIREDTN